MTTGNESVTTKEEVDFPIQISLLKLFHQYNFELVVAKKKGRGPFQLYTTVTVKCPLDSPLAMVTGPKLEVVLHNIVYPILNEECSTQKLLAITRLVADIPKFIASTKMTGKNSPSIRPLTSIVVPSSNAADFKVATYGEHRGTLYSDPYIVSSSDISITPKFDSTYFFTAKSDAIFSDTAGVVLEFYNWDVKFPDPGAYSGWTPLRADCIGRAFCRLDQEKRIKLEKGGSVDCLLPLDALLRNTIIGSPSTQNVIRISIRLFHAGDFVSNAELESVLQVGF